MNDSYVMVKKFINPPLGKCLLPSRQTYCESLALVSFLNIVEKKIFLVLMNFSLTKSSLSLN